MKVPALIFSLSLLCTACGGGGGGASTTPPAPIAQPPVFESPHPATWETQSAADAGFDTAALEEAFGYAMADGSFTQAALVVKAGKLVDERYRGIAEGEVATITSLSSTPTAQDPAFWQNDFGSRDRDSLVTSWSTAKSFTSFLIGIAIEKGLINSTSQPASDFITE